MCRHYSWCWRYSSKQNRQVSAFVEMTSYLEETDNEQTNENIVCQTEVSAAGQKEEDEACRECGMSVVMICRVVVEVLRIRNHLNRGLKEVRKKDIW